MISIIVPHHKESIDKMMPLLCSLNGQVGINFQDMELLVVNDNEECKLVPEDFINYKNIYPRVRTFFNEKEGYMGISRQIGIDEAEGEYLVFCDADDAIYCNTLLFDLLTRTGADVYSYSFIEQMENGQWLEHPSQFTWMFAKSYKKQFLLDHDIRFHDDILWHEDTYFNQVLLSYNPTIEHLTYTGYVWLFSPNTITRNNGSEYTSRSLCMYIDALDARLDRIKYRLSKQQKEDTIINDIVYMYCSLMAKVQTHILDGVRKDIEDRLAKYILKWDKKMTFLNEENYPKISRRIMESFNNSIIIPDEGLTQFAERIVANYNKM